MLDENIYKHFTKTINDYDTVSDKVVIKNDELHNELIKAVDFDTNKSINVLDLGCGTGHGMSLVLEKFPNSKITGIDFSGRMIEQAEEKLKQYGDRITLIEANFNEIDFTEKYDAVISAVAIHNATHQEKEALFKRIFEALKQDGAFINGDFVAGENEGENIEFQDVYRKHLEKNLSGDELKVWLYHAFQEDMPMKLSKQFEILRQVGFLKVDFLWKTNNEVVYRAKKK